MNKTNWLLNACAGLICLASISSAHADGVKPQLIPECKVFKLGAIEVCGYTDLRDVKKLLVLDSELVKRRAQTKLLTAKVDAQGSIIGDLRVALDAERRADVIIRDRNAALTKQLIETDRRLQLAKVRPRWGSALSWGVAAVLGGILLGVTAEKMIR